MSIESHYPNITSHHSVAIKYHESADNYNADDVVDKCKK